MSTVANNNELTWTLVGDPKKIPIDRHGATVVSVNDGHKTGTLSIDGTGEILPFSLSTRQPTAMIDDRVKFSIPRYRDTAYVIGNVWIDFGCRSVEVKKQLKLEKEKVRKVATELRRAKTKVAKQVAAEKRRVMKQRRIDAVRTQTRVAVTGSWARGFDDHFPALG